jgi:colanic acid biosynthesis glycosyl transferase WcaI
VHVLILNQTFWPDVAATAQLMWDLARHLDRRGHRVTAVASRHFYGTDREIPAARERVGNIRIRRVRGTGFGKGSSLGTLGRLSDFASFYAAAAVELTRVDDPPPDVILALTSPPMIATLAALRKPFAAGPGGGRTRFVYHVMDLYPDVVTAAGRMSPSHPLARAMGACTGYTLREADAVIALGRDMRDRLLRRYGRHVSADRVHVVPPWADGQALRPLSKADNALAGSLGLRNTFNVVYSGNLGVAHDVETLVAAIDQTRDDAGMQWLFIGGGNRFDAVAVQARERSWPHVRFLPFQDRERLNESLNLADVHLVSQLPAFTGVVVPSKLFGILAVGKPAVMVGPADAEVSRIIAEHEAGVVVRNGDADGLVHELRRLRDDATTRNAMGRRGRAAFEQKYDDGVACARIEAILCGNARARRAIED